jgi:O-antigen biosynthesis protein
MMDFMRSVIYTAIFNNYDELKQPAVQDSDCDFICFTDQPMPARVGAWNVVHVNTRAGMHPRMQAKRFKLLSHKVFPYGLLAFRHRLWCGALSLRNRYACSIWVDGSLKIKGESFSRDMAAAAADPGWAIFRHMERDCIFEEAAVSATIKKYCGLPVFEQVEAYRREGVIEHGGLFECGVIARQEPLNGRVRRVNELWWKENEKWTYQDQLSLPYVLKATGTTVGIIPGNIWNNKWCDWIAHRTEK